MEVMQFYIAHPFWWWLVMAVALLAIEVATGAELFLWPAMAAGTMAVLAGAYIHMPVGADIALFLLLTAGAVAVARRLQLRADRERPGAPDRLVGVKGAVVTQFQRGAGRVLVEGAEWPAEVEGEANGLLPGDRIIVAKVLDDGRLQVRPG